MREEKKEEKKEDIVRDQKEDIFVPEMFIPAPPAEKKVEEPKPKMPEAPKPSDEPSESTQVALAYELEQLFEQDFFKMLKFVKRYPGLGKEELIEKYLCTQHRA